MEIKIELTFHLMATKRQQPRNGEDEVEEEQRSRKIHPP